MLLTPAAVSQVRRAVRGALLLEGGASAPLWTWRGQVPEPAFIAAVERHRVGLLLADHVETLDLPEPVRARLRAQRDAERRAALDLIRLTSYVDSLLADVPHLHLKGVALATLSTGDPTARGGGDVDVVVDPGRLDDAAAALVADGWKVRPTYTSDQEAWAWRYQRWGAHEMAFDRAGLTVDLHWRLDPTYDGLPRFADLWTRRQQVKVGPVEVETLDTADAFAHSLRHAAKDGWESLRSLVDVHRLAREPAAHEVALGRLDHATLSAVDATVG
ncbi:nucleotidyltransferase family protein, partial [Nocardioides stalactiti]|uniref:nucleotidyltransferase family protein n=1 Tax=Nocardioides stalactiti TaxID=2755356 RepID=UPI0016047640